MSQVILNMTSVLIVALITRVISLVSALSINNYVVTVTCVCATHRGFPDDFVTLEVFFIVLI